ncbi:fibropellin-1 isoform X1 [Hydra vulgaris]|uniref:fibropellin-1 isoform X1 n=1 Tax=Hydra vulgaris TaxID=6087 RepID=UPI001F5F3D28|nr:fibropellin-1 isoform X2 [Hydra vulgaris]
MPLPYIFFIVSIYNEVYGSIEDLPLIYRGACISNPCLNNGLCTITPNGFLCTCVGGYIGVQCEKRADECPDDNRVSCEHGDCRLDLSAQPRCMCNDGYQGLNCDEKIDSCISNPCFNNGTCISKTIGYECQCLSDTYGVQCQIKKENILKCVSSCDGFANDGRCWHETAKDVIVGWGYGDYICNTKKTCFNLSSSTSDKHDYIEVQLKPIHMQNSDELVFVTDIDSELYGYNFIPHILPLETDSELAFKSCNITNAQPITNIQNVNSKLNVNASLLVIGTQYFIADFNEIHRCVLGLRLNVTVKDKDCHDPSNLTGLMCNGRGKCYSDFNMRSFECLCCEGFVGKYCQYEDLCFTNPCKHGVCKLEEDEDGIVTHQCECDEGFDGATCNQRTNACESNPCLNNGWCIEQGSRYKCQCLNGYSGVHCEKKFDYCLSRPCLNGGSCKNGLKDFHCDCLPGYKGTICEINIDECAASPCLKGTCLDTINNFTCACIAGYVGRLCDVVLNECSSSFCENGVCVKQNEEYSCSCGIGYTGMHCELKVDLCTFSNFCIKNNADSCEDHGSNVSCVCKSGWSGSNCGINFDDCLNNKCTNGARCVDKLNGYDCHCPYGFTGMFCEIGPPKQNTDIIIEFTTDSCQMLLNDLNHVTVNTFNILGNLCKCNTDNDLLLQESKVLCKDETSGIFKATLKINNLQWEKNIICSLQKSLQKKEKHLIYNNTYIHSVLNSNEKCIDLYVEANMARKVGSADNSNNTIGVVVGILVGLSIFIFSLFIWCVKLRNNRMKVGTLHKFQKEDITFDNPAYAGETYNENETICECCESTDFQETKWAHKYDSSRKLFLRERSVPAGRLFDLHTKDEN